MIMIEEMTLFSFPLVPQAKRGWCVALRNTLLHLSIKQNAVSGLVWCYWEFFHSLEDVDTTSIAKEEHTAWSASIDLYLAHCSIN